MYTAKVSIHLRCPKHTRFNPERDGERAIKGGCVCCVALCRIHDAVFKVVQAVRAADGEGCVSPAPKIDKAKIDRAAEAVHAWPDFMKGVSNAGKADD